MCWNEVDNENMCINTCKFVDCRQKLFTFDDVLLYA